MEPDDTAPATAIARADIQAISPFTQGLNTFLESHGLPTDNVLVSVEERRRVIGNVGDALTRLDADQRGRALYVSKFTAAVAAGLFDAALTYLWDETVQELRRRIAHYDLSYFFDVAVKSPDKRKRLRTADDLDKIDDAELLEGAREIGLISNVGYRQLDHIRYIRNWASAAHPNQHELTGLQLVAWLETCILEVVTLPLSVVVVQVKQLLVNVKASALDETRANQAGAFFANLDRERAESLASGFFGIYVDPDSTEQTRQNVRFLLPRLWPLLNDDARRQLGVRYAQHVANGDEQPATLARAFLDVVNAATYIPDPIRAAELQEALQDLLRVHRAPLNNFHNEPAFAKRLSAVAGATGSIPDAIEPEYVRALTEVFLTNGHGVAWNAESTYKALIEQFTPQQAARALVSFTDQVIATKLQRQLSRTKFAELLTLLEDKLTSPIAQELLAAVRAFTGPLERMSNDSTIQRRVTVLREVLGF